MQQILEKQNGYQFLDSKPQTLTAKAHRPSYGTDGDYSLSLQPRIFTKKYML
jgi:hypothetical protein